MNKILNFFYTFFLTLSCSLQADTYIIGELLGQLGNQIFQIAATTSLALDHGAIPVFPCLEKPASPQFNFLLNRQTIFHRVNCFSPYGINHYTYREPNFKYDPLPYHPNMRLQGWFQSEKYFVHHKDKILELFAPSPQIIHYLQTKYGYIIDHPKTVSIHFRSYLKEDPRQHIYYTLNVDYYQEAISQFPEDSLFVVFSNQIEWCKKNFASIPRQFIYIEKEQHQHDLYLMSLCKNHIIGNSTFSWWGAYLNKNENKIVIAPPQWFNPTFGADTRDLIPESWTILQH